jgi:hypothetical protein
MSELQDRIPGIKTFMQMDLNNGHHLIRIKKGHEWKTAFHCRYSFYEFMVMPFGLNNVLAIFHDMMNPILKDFVNEGRVVYNIDIFIYVQMQEKHGLLVQEF